MSAQNSTRLTRSSPAEAKKNDVFLAAAVQQLSGTKGLEDLAGSLGSRSSGQKSSSDSDHRYQEKSPLRVSKTRSQASSKSKPKSKRLKVTKPKAKPAAGAVKARKQGSEKLSQIFARVEEAGDRLQECVICVEKKGKYAFLWTQ